MTAHESDAKLRAKLIDCIVELQAALSEITEDGKELLKEQIDHLMGDNDLIFQLQLSTQRIIEDAYARNPNYGMNRSIRQSGMYQ